MVLLYYVVWPFCLFAFYANGLFAQRCTYACRCYSTKMDCTNGFWKRIPDVQKNTKRLTITNSKIGILEGPPVCKNHDGLTDLFIKQSGVTGIDNDAFKCLINLTWLYLSGNELKVISPVAIKHLSNLRAIHMDKNELTAEVVKTVCHLDKIRQINLSYNGMIRHLP